MLKLIILSVGILYLYAAVMLTVKARLSNISWSSVLFRSLLLTPIMGYLYIIKARGSRIIKLYRYQCPRCHTVFTEKLPFCHYCAKDNIKSPLKKRVIHSL